MAVYATNSGLTPNRNRACVLPPPGATGVGHNVVANPNPPSTAALESHAAVLDDRFKVGGSTTWERPAASGV